MSKIETAVSEDWFTKEDLIELLEKDSTVKTYQTEDTKIHLTDFNVFVCVHSQEGFLSKEINLILFKGKYEDKKDGTVSFKYTHVQENSRWVEIGAAKILVALGYQDQIYNTFTVKFDEEQFSIFWKLGYSSWKFMILEDQFAKRVKKN